MEPIYKLTDKNGCTQNATLWLPDVTQTAPGSGPLCTTRWIHAYTDPLVAVLMDPVHGNFGPNARMFRGLGKVGQRDLDGKVGLTACRPVEWIEPPVVTTVQRVAFGILCAMEVYRDEEFVTWARAWLDGSDRTERAAAAARAAPAAATWAAARAAPAAAAARAATREATWAAAWAAVWAIGAAWATREAWAAARAAAWAAWVAADTKMEFNLTTLAHQALRVDKPHGLDSAKAKGE